MKTRFKHNINYYGILLAIGSFTIGSLLLLLYKLTQIGGLITTGLLYVYLATFLNGIMLVVVLVNALKNYKEYPENLITIGILLLNIPITIGYIDIVI